MSTTPISELPVGHIVSKAVRLAWITFCELLPTIWPWLALWMAGELMVSWMIWPYDNHPTTSSQHEPVRVFLSLMQTILPVILGAIIAVPWHRRLLLAETPDTKLLAVSPNFALYFRWALALAMFAEAPMFLIDLAPAPDSNSGKVGAAGILMLFAVVSSFIIPRVFLILPARALGNAEIQLRDVWQRTHGNTFRLFFASFFVAVLPFLPYLGLALLFPDEPNQTETLIFFFITELMSVASALGLLTFLSLAYRHFYMPVDHAAA